MGRLSLIASGEVNIDEETDASLKVLAWYSNLQTE
jgi:hypothetical protein